MNLSESNVQVIRGLALLAAFALGLALERFAPHAALDLLSYGWHRANHRVGLLWRFHRVHRADADYHVSTAFRFHPGELLLALPVRLAAITRSARRPKGSWSSRRSSASRTCSSTGTSIFRFASSGSLDGCW